MNTKILDQWMKNKVTIQINDKTKKCTIVDIDDVGILVEYYKYKSKDLVYYTYNSMTKIKPIIPE